MTLTGGKLSARAKEKQPHQQHCKVFRTPHGHTLTAPPHPGNAKHTRRPAREQRAESRYKDVARAALKHQLLLLQVHAKDAVEEGGHGLDVFWLPLATCLDIPLV